VIGGGVLQIAAPAWAVWIGVDLLRSRSAPHAG